MTEYLITPQVDDVQVNFPGNQRPLPGMRPMPKITGRFATAAEKHRALTALRPLITQVLNANNGQVIETQMFAKDGVQVALLVDVSEEGAAALRRELGKRARIDENSKVGFFANNKAAVGPAAHI